MLGGLDQGARRVGSGCWEGRIRVLGGLDQGVGRVGSGC